MNKITHKINEHLLIEIVGEFDDTIVDHFKKIVDSYQKMCFKKKNNPQIIVDLVKSTKLTASGSGTLVSLLKNLGRTNGSLVLVTDNNISIDNQLDLTHLNKVFEVYHTKDEAIRSLQIPHCVN